jgi:hypothetical protein
MDGVAHEPTTAPSMFNGEWAVLSTIMIAMNALSLVERLDTLTCDTRDQRQAERKVDLQDMSLAYY